jgi:hypothetical protein
VAYACFTIRDHNGQALSRVYFENEKGKRTRFKQLTLMRPHASQANIAKLPELLKRTGINYASPHPSTAVIHNSGLLFARHASMGASVSHAKGVRGSGTRKSLWSLLFRLRGDRYWYRFAVGLRPRRLHHRKEGAQTAGSSARNLSEPLGDLPR